LKGITQRQEKISRCFVDAENVLKSIGRMVFKNGAIFPTHISPWLSEMDLRTANDNINT
jgi:hypothetical protein